MVLYVAKVFPPENAFPYLLVVTGAKCRIVSSGRESTFLPMMLFGLSGCRRIINDRYPRLMKPVCWRIIKKMMRVPLYRRKSTKVKSRNSSESPGRILSQEAEMMYSNDDGHDLRNIKRLLRAGLGPS